MDKNKQIEILTRDIQEKQNGGWEFVGNSEYTTDVANEELAEHLYELGYCKASDVAEEIYNELDRYSYPSAFGGWAISMDSVSYVLKKYLGKDLNVPTKESEITK